MGSLAMYRNMNFPAPLAALGFLAACAATVLCGCTVLAALFLGKRRIAVVTIGVVAPCAVLYLGLLFGFSFSSRDISLARGQEKYFCEIDCHLAYSIVDLKQDLAAASRRYVITLRTRFDETTISSRRPKGRPLTPSPRTMQLVDASGAHYLPEAIVGTPLPTPLIPGQSYTTQVIFQMPPHATDPKLLIQTTPQWPDHIVIGDENSWLHGKTYLAL